MPPLISALIVLLAIGLIVGLIYWVCDSWPVPQPLNKVIKTVAMVIGVLAIVILLLNLGGFTAYPLGPRV